MQNVQIVQTVQNMNANPPQIIKNISTAFYHLVLLKILQLNIPGNKNAKGPQHKHPIIDITYEKSFNNNALSDITIITSKTLVNDVSKY